MNDTITVMIAEARTALDILEEAARKQTFTTQGRPKLLTAIAHFLSAVDPLLGLAAAKWKAEPDPLPTSKHKSK